MNQIILQILLIYFFFVLIFFLKKKIKFKFYLKKFKLPSNKLFAVNYGITA